MCVWQFTSSTVALGKTRPPLYIGYKGSVKSLSDLKVVKNRRITDMLNILTMHKENLNVKDDTSKNMPDIKSYNLYLDSSADPGWNPPYGRSRLRFYVVGGLALTAESDLHAYHETDRILKRYIPAVEWRSPKFELCYHHLLRGKGIFSTLTHAQRLAMANDVFDLILTLKTPLFASVVDKLRLKQKYGVEAYDPKLLGIRATIHRFSMFLESRSAVGNVTMDSEEYRKDHKIQEMVRTFKRTGIIIRGFLYNPMYTDRIGRVLNTINFTDSNMSPGIQLADFICRTTWQHYERSKSQRFKQISPLWNRDGTRIYEPSMFPK